jgi:hypothetical protein
VITVFVGTFNRLETLERTLDSYEKLTTPHEIVIVDNGTDHPKCLELLGKLEKRVKKIYSLGRISTMEELTDNYSIAMRDQFMTSEVQWFAVTDADICFEGSAPDSLDAYLKLYKKTGWSAGPHTRVDASLPAGYPFRTRVIATEARTQYRATNNWDDEIACSPWPIDTTFHLFPRISKFNRLKFSTVRCGPPYDAMHLDWYIDFNNLTEENMIYALDEYGMVGAWGRRWLRDMSRIVHEEGPEAMYESLLQAERSEGDLCNTSFVLSWCHQYGFGTKQDTFKSVLELRNAISPDTVWWPLLEDSIEMIYRGDFSCLGW